jgi:Ca2+-binding RTX toxin-like protein
MTSTATRINAAELELATGGFTERHGTDGANTLIGDAGPDKVFGERGSDVILTGDGNDEAHGGSGADTINAGAGDDKVFGGVGNDGIGAGEGNDEVHAGTGNDNVNAGEGNDKVFGGEGSDNIQGRLGSDELHGEAGNDALDGGYRDGAVDKAFGGEGNDSYIWSPTDGNDEFHGGDGQDTLFLFKVSEADLRAGVQLYTPGLTMTVAQDGTVTFLDAQNRPATFSGELRIGGETLKFFDVEKLRFGG